MGRVKRYSGFTVGLLAAVFFAATAGAGEVTWSGAPGGAYTLGGNWVGGGAPVDDLVTDTALFDGSATAGTVSMNAIRSVGGINLATSGWTLDGFSKAGSTTSGSVNVTMADTTDVANTMLVTATPDQWVNWANVSNLVANTSFDLYSIRGAKGTTTGATTLNFYAPLTVGANGLTSTGGGTNTINVPVNTGANPIVIGNAGDATGSTLVVNRGLAMAAGGSLVFNAGADSSKSTLTIVAEDYPYSTKSLYNISGEGNLTLNATGDGAIALQTANTYTGTTTIIGSYISGTNGPRIDALVSGAFGSGPVILNSGVLNCGTAGTDSTFANDLTLGGGTLVLNPGAASASWTGNMDMTGNGQLSAPYDATNDVFTFGAAGNTIANNTATDRQLAICPSSPHGGGNSETIHIDSAIVQNSTGNITVRINRNLNNQDSSNAYTVVYNEPGSNYSGATNVYRNGTLKAGVDNAFSPASYVNLVDATSTIDFDGYDAPIGGLYGVASSTVSNVNGTLRIGDGTSGPGTAQYSGFAGTLADTDSTTGTLGVEINLPAGNKQCFTSTSAYTYTGGTTVNGGLLSINAAGGFNPIPGTIYMNGTSGLAGWNYAITMNNPIVLGAGSDVSFSNGVTYTFNGLISGGDASSVLNVGASVINNSNTFTGRVVTANYGTFKFYNANALNGNPIDETLANVNANGLDLNGFTVPVQYIRYAPGRTMSLVNTAATPASLVLGTGYSGDMDFGGNFAAGTAYATSDYSIVWNGTGVLSHNLNNGTANSYRGGTFVTGGGIISAISDTLLGAPYNAGTAPNSFITLSNGGGVYFWNGGNITRPIVLGTGGGTVYASQNNGTIGTVQPVSGTGPFTVSTVDFGGNQNGTLIFRDIINTYSGDTNINNIGTGFLNVTAEVTDSSTVVQSFGDSTATPRTIHFGGGSNSTLYLRANGDGTTSPETIYMGSSTNPYNVELTSDGTLAPGRSSVGGSAENKDFAFGNLTLGNGAVLTGQSIAYTTAYGYTSTFASGTMKDGGGTLNPMFTGITITGPITVDDSVAPGTTATLTLGGGNGNGKVISGSLDLPGILSDNAGDSSKKLGLAYTPWYNSSVQWTVSGANTYSGGTTYAAPVNNNTCSLVGVNPNSDNTLRAFGTGPINLLARDTWWGISQLYLRADGSGSGQTIAMGNDLTSDWLTGGTNPAVNTPVNHLYLEPNGGTNTGNTFAMGNLTLYDGARLTVHSSNDYDLSFSAGLTVPSGTGMVGLSGAGGTITVSGTPAVIGSGTLQTTSLNYTDIELNGPAGWTGGTIMTLNAHHTVVAGHQDALGGFVEVNSHNTLELNASQVDIAGLRTTTNNGNPVRVRISDSFSGPVTLYDNVPAGQTFSYIGQICNLTDPNPNLKFVKDGEGTQEFTWESGQSYFTGGLELRQGTLMVTTWQGIIGTGGQGPITFAGGTLGARNGNYANNWYVGLGASDYNVGTFDGGIDVQTLTLPFTLSGLGGTGSLAKYGPGTLQFSSGAYSIGAVNVDEGVVNVDGKDVAIGDGTVGSLTGGGTITNDNASTAATLTYNGAPALSTFAGTLTDGASALTLTVTGGTLELTGGSSYTGGTNLDGGVLVLGSPGAIGNTGAVSFAGGTLRHTAANTSDYSARFSNASGQAYSIDTNGQDVTLATGLTSAGGSLAKLGDGTLTLDGAHSYSGTTTVADGTLLVNGSHTGGAYTVLSGAVLGGVGSITAPTITVDPGAAFEPGMSPGTLTLNANLNLNGDAIFELGRWVPAPPAGEYDFSVVNGALTLGETSSLTAVEWDGRQPQTWYPIFQYDSLLGAFGRLGSSIIGIDYDYLGLSQIAIMVPEPAGLAVLALATLALIGRRRR